MPFVIAIYFEPAFTPISSSKTRIALSSAIDVAWDRGALALFIFKAADALASFNSVLSYRVVLLSARTLLSAASNA